MKLASNANPPIDEEEIERIRSIKLPLTIQHPLDTSKKMYKGLVSMLGGEDNLKKVQMWGKRPEEEQERLSSGDEDEDDITSEDSVDEEESEFEEGPSKVPQKQIPKSQDPPASSSRPTVGDKRPPGNKRKCMNPIIIIHEIYFGSR